MTRQNFIPSPDGAANVTSLVPLFDMCNHANGRVRCVSLYCMLTRVLETHNIVEIPKKGA